MVEMVAKSGALLELLDKIEVLGQFQDRINFPANIRQIWNVFLDDIRNLIEIRACALFLVDDATHEFVLKQTWPEGQKKVCQQEIDLQIECGIFSWVTQRRQPALVPALAFKDVKSLVLLPLTSVKRTLGVVLVVTPIKESLITQENMKLFTMLSKQCSMVIENTLLYERLNKKHQSLKKANGEIRLLSRTDPLTGCYNRGYLNQHLPHEIKRAVRYNHALSLVLCDIDHFKKVNDTFGHQCGDVVLKALVQSITSLIRSDMDWLARYGGEEFLLVLPETKVANASGMADRLRRHLAAEEIECQGERISITVSFGVTGFDAARPFNRISAEGLINSADQYLYAAKNQGRNRVVSGPFLPPDQVPAQR